MGRLSLLFVTCFLGAGSVGCAGLGSYSPLRPLESAILFQPGFAIESPTAAAGAEDVQFPTNDGLVLHGRFFDSRPARAAVLYCHGNAGSVATWSSTARELRQRHRVAVFLFDYRGYGQSQGRPSEPGILADGQAARRWLMERTGLDESGIVLLGRSLGGAVAVDLAANGGARGLILQSTFSSLPDVAAFHCPWALPQVMMSQRLDSVAKLKHYHGPLLQSHGDADRLIPLASAQKLFDAAGGPKQFVTVAGADHNDPNGESYAIALDQFLESLARSQ